VFESEILIEAAWHQFFSSPVEIAAIYPEKRRASHFKPVRDISHITQMVAKRLFQRKMHLPGLYAILAKRKPSVHNN
jgi:hypothetical protein